QLNREIDRFLESVDNSIRGEFNKKSGEYVFRLSGEPPPEWGILVGEWAHELRVILDNMISALVIKRGNQVTIETSFIIADNYNKWNGGSGQALRGLLKSDKALVKRRQPYIRGDKALDHPLSRLSWINNTDKHRLLHATASFIQFPSRLPDKWPCFPVLDEPSDAVFGNVWFKQSALLTKDGTIFCGVVLTNAGSNPKMHMNGDIPIAVSFTGTERPLGLDNLFDIRREVREIITEFEPILIK
ncbi:MAG: hypothetical protein H8E40_04250, partial [Chloroflexi bacterium]|nr:hypothetical protein [Chloroflexota bacterium]